MTKPKKLNKLFTKRLVLSKTEYKKLTIEVLKRDGWKCRCCGKRNNLSCHHIIYRSHGGDDSLKNLISLCMKCHDEIHNASLVLLFECSTPNANKEIKFERILK